MRNDQIFVLLLVVLLPMSGCMESAVGEVEGTEETSSETTIVNNYYNNTSTNELPLLYIWDDDVNCQNRNSCSWSWHISVSDLDGNVTEVGVDHDLDGLIDNQFISSDWSVHVQEFEGPVNLSTDNAVQKKQSHEWCYFAFNLIVIDDDGGKNIQPYTRIVGECD